jgi:hypothetical protein
MTEFERELEVFRREEESAQQFFFSYLSVRKLAASNPDVLRMMNVNPLFWVTAHYSMLVAAFVALPRTCRSSRWMRSGHEKRWTSPQKKRPRTSSASMRSLPPT